MCLYITIPDILLPEIHGQVIIMFTLFPRSSGRKCADKSESYYNYFRHLAVENTRTSQNHIITIFSTFCCQKYTDKSESYYNYFRHLAVKNTRTSQNHVLTIADIQRTQMRGQVRIIILLV